MNDDPSPQNSQGPNSHSDKLDDACRRFEAAWRDGQQPSIDDYLGADPAAEGLRELLIALVGIDLEYRWQKAAGASAVDGTVDTSILPGQPRLADYVARYPTLGPLEELPTELIAHEYWVRHRWGDRPGRDEYLAAYGRQHPTLDDVLAEIDQELGAEGADGPGALHIHCPHCHNPVEIVDDGPLAEFDCPSCGSSFSLVGDEAVIGPSVGGTADGGPFRVDRQTGHGGLWYRMEGPRCKA